FAGAAPAHRARARALWGTAPRRARRAEREPRPRRRSRAPGDAARLEGGGHHHGGRRASSLAARRGGQGARAARGRGRDARHAGRSDGARRADGAAGRMIDLDRTVKTGFLFVALGGCALGGWATLAPLSGAVIAPGYVKVDLNRKVVQHQEGGIVREIRVRDGDEVRQGEPLVVLEDVRIDD